MRISDKLMVYIQLCLTDYPEQQRKKSERDIINALKKGAWRVI